MKVFDDFFKLAINCRIESFKFRNEQGKLLLEANALNVKSLKYKLKDDLENSDLLKQEAFNKKQQARDNAIEATYLTIRASRLEKQSYALIEMLNDDWKAQINLKDEREEL